MKDKSLGGYQALIKMQWPWSLCAEEESSRTHYDWCCTVQRKEVWTHWCPSFIPCSEFLNSEEE